MSSTTNSMDADSYPNDALAVGTVLNGYRIISVLGRGTFGITYLATEERLDRLVAVKEYLPQEFATREESSTVRARTESQNQLFKYGRNSFLTEARTQVKFRHPNIVRVLTFFELNETAYIVMEYEEGISLGDYFKQHPGLTQTELLAIFAPIIEGLATVHQYGFIHRDIKPKNILIRANQSPVLLDFGAARDVITNKTDELTRILTQGFAPYEQENPAWASQGPWTDIYALGATLYTYIVGQKPENGSQRAAARMMKKLDPYIPAVSCQDVKYSRAFLVAIDSALEFDPEKRPQSLNQWLRMLSREERESKLMLPKDLVTENRAESSKKPKPVSATKNRLETLSNKLPGKTQPAYSIIWLIPTAVAVLLLTIGGGIYLFSSSESTAERSADKMNKTPAIQQQSVNVPNVMAQNEATHTPDESSITQTAQTTAVENKTPDTKTTETDPANSTTGSIDNKSSETSGISSTDIVLAPDSGIQLKHNQFIISEALEQTLRYHIDHVQRLTDGSLIIYLDQNKLYLADDTNEFSLEGMNLLNRMDYVFRNHQNFLILITDRATHKPAASKAGAIRDFLIEQGLPRGRIQTAVGSTRNQSGFSGIEIQLTPQIPANS